jgi:hypothetical protein
VTITSPQTPETFLVKNKKAGGFSSQGIQSALDSNFKMVTTTDTIINKPLGFNPSNTNEALSITPWSCLAYTNDNQSVYLMPSLGSTVNQTNNECFSTIGTEIVDVTLNPAIHNGSTRLFWEAPNYGYFDVDKIEKPEPDQYLREIYNDQELQQNFGLFGDQTQYSKISELLTAFSPEVLDKFETQFLLFSDSIDDFESNLSPRNGNLETEERFENFQGLMREMFKIEKPDENLTGSALINELKEKQKQKIQKTLEEFFDYQVVFKHGNPSNFDRKLFYTFSNEFIIDPYTWNGYIPNSLPSQNGTTTLAQSKAQFPQTWNTLETYVGFSDIPGLEYTDNGSYDN